MTKHEDPEVFYQAYDLYQQGAYRDAYDLLTAAILEHPAHVQRVYEWRMDLAARMGDPELSEKVFEDALDAGFFFNEFALRKDEDLIEMQGRPRFEALVARNFEILAEAQKHAVPRLELFNRGVEEKSTLPLLLALHGNNSNNLRFRENWESLRGSNWLVALAQSSQVSGKGLYSWDDLAAAEREVKEHYRQLIGAFAVDPARVLVAGFSRGAHAVLLAAVQEWVHVTGFIAIAPGVGDPKAWEPLLEQDYQGALRGCFLLGEQDERCTPGALALSELLIQHGIPCQVRVFPGVGHDFPPDFAQVLQDSIRFILNGSENDQS